MSYRIDKADNSIVIEGFENGIADSPYNGISDMRNVNIVSIPKEASVNFATSAISPPIIATGSVTSSNAGTDYFTYTGAAGLENYMTVVFSVQSGTGLSINAAYWVKNLGGAGAGTFQLTTDYAQTGLFDITGNGTGTFSVAQISVEPITGSGSGQPKFFTYDPTDAKYFMLTTAGALWSNWFTTTSGYWTYMGPSGTSTGLNQGAGLGYYQSFDAANRYIFVFRNTTIDYFSLNAPSDFGWHYGWKPIDGSTSNAGAVLNTNTTFHSTLVGQDNVFYWCDGPFLGSFFETPDGPPQTIVFDPTSTATYTYAKQALALPTQDRAQCLAELGVNLLIGGKNNAIYPWNRTSTSFTYPILIAESNIQQMVTVNTNTFIFPGNRGRIYLTNGSQASLWKKVPDHISGTVEPYFTWGGACSQKNQLYFSMLATTNAGGTISQYGGVWAVDLDTKAIRLTNKLSYDTYAGYALCLIPNFGTNPAGTGLFIGWDKNSGSIRGIDTTISTPYTGSQAVVVSDLIPIGTFDKPMDFERMEYKLSKPMVSGESINLYARLIFNTTDTGFGSAILTDSTVGNFSSSAPVNFKNAQWLQLEAVLNSTASSPSYTRLTQIRIKRPSQ